MPLRSGDPMVNAYGRLRPGFTVETAQAHLPAGVALLSLHVQEHSTMRRPLFVLAGVVLCVLLIASLNIGGLQMERTLARRQELVLRLALGAGRGRLFRQIVTENLLLALAGAAAGVALAALAQGTIKSLLPLDPFELDRIAVDLRVLAATVAAAGLAGLVSGLLPVSQLTGLSLTPTLGAGGRLTNRSRLLGRRALVVAQVAVSMAVLVGAGLMVQTFLTLRPSEPGFDPSGKWRTEVRLPNVSSEDGARVFADLLARVSEEPTIRSAAWSTYIPLMGVSSSSLAFDEAGPGRVNTIRVTSGYFELMRIPVLAGRTFTAAEARASSSVVVVNETLARRLGGGADVVGRRVRARPRTRAGEPVAPGVDLTVVGVIADGRFFGSRLDSFAEAYVPIEQMPVTSAHLIVAVAPQDAAAATQAVRRAIRHVAPEVAVAEFESLQAIADASVRLPRLGAWLLGTFAGLAVVLASVGLMTTIGWWVRQRTREVGVRLALGASRASIARLVLGQGLSLGAAGIAIGCLTAAGLTRYLEGWIYGVAPLDLPTFAGAAGVMLAVTAAAVAAPVYRASAVDPVQSLRA